MDPVITALSDLATGLVKLILGTICAISLDQNEN